MQLIKLTYIAHGWHLSLTNGQPLINEDVEAWRYGPVIRPLYRRFRDFGDKPIPSYVIPSLPDVSNRTGLSAFLNYVWDAYKTFSGPQLSTMTHQRGTPWWVTWNLGGGKDCLDETIPDSRIKEHYDQLKASRSNA